MNWRIRIVSIGFAAAASALLAQETPTTSSTQTTSTSTTKNADGSTTTTTINGEVVRYEPGKTIVVRDTEHGTVTYTLDSSVTVPADVQVGRKVTIYTQPGENALRVQRITTTSSTDASGAATTHTEVRDEPASSMGNPPQPAQTTQSTQTRTTTVDAAPAPAAPAEAPMTKTTTTTRATTVSGTVRAYEPGQSITVVGPGNKTTTYTITTDSQLPQDIAVGKRVTVQTTIVAGKPVVRSVTSKTTTTTKTTQSKSLTPQ